jgi:hypothetical protein
LLLLAPPAESGKEVIFYPEQDDSKNTQNQSNVSKRRKPDHLTGLVSYGAGDHKVMTDRERSCEARIAEELKSTNTYLVNTYQEIDQASEVDDYEKREELEEAIAPYGVTVVRTVRLTLSGGGPASWLDVELDETNSPAQVEYHFADWFDHAATVVTEEEAPGLWRMAEQYAEIAA